MNYYLLCFNPSSNGNGAGMSADLPTDGLAPMVSILLLMEMVLEFQVITVFCTGEKSFNPSSNGNGAGIF